MMEPLTVEAMTREFLGIFRLHGARWVEIAVTNFKRKHTLMGTCMSQLLESCRLLARCCIQLQFPVELSVCSWLLLKELGSWYCTICTLASNAVFYGNSRKDDPTNHHPSDLD